jgi:predicted nucleic acid-binding protein
LSVPAPFGGDVLLADTSVWRRADRLPGDTKNEWDRALVNNQIASSPVVLFELLYRSRNNREYFHRWRVAFEGLYRYLIPDRQVWAIAREAYVELQDGSQLEGTSLTDIVFAATATRHTIPVLHYDRDFNRLATLECMDFEARQILPPGTDVAEISGPSEPEQPS